MMLFPWKNCHQLYIEFLQYLKAYYEYVANRLSVARSRRRSHKSKVPLPINNHKRFVCFRPILSSELGHPYNNSLGLRDALILKDWEVVFLSQQNTVATIQKELDAIAVLPHANAKEHWPANWKCIFWESLLHSHLGPVLHERCWVYFPEATFSLAAAAIEWVRSLPAHLRPILILEFLSYYLFIGRNSPKIETDKALFFKKYRKTDESVKGAIVVCTEVGYWAAQLSSQFGCEVLVVPTTKKYDDFDGRAQHPSHKKSIHIGLLGRLREEKGVALLPEIIDYFRSRGDIQFVLQIDTDNSKPVHDFLMNQSNVQILGDRLSREVYVETLCKMDIMMFPYDPIRFAAHSSGVFCEAVAAGIPTIVPEGTWMGNHVTAGHAAGAVFTPYTSAAAVKALEECMRNLSAQTEMARTLAPAWRKKWSAESFYRIIAEEIERRDQLTG